MVKISCTIEVQKGGDVVIRCAEFGNVGAESFGFPLRSTKDEKMALEVNKQLPDWIRERLMREVQESIRLTRGESK